MTVDAAEARRSASPLFGRNRMKLGTFATNVSNGAAITKIDGVFETTWPNVRRLAEIADQAGFEAIVPVARWRGFGGPTNFNGRNFETYTWAAGVGAITKNPAIFATSHVPTVHPLVAAKQATTVDHITGGRFALNIVCGWFQPEMEMFGAPIMDHETRYDYAEEWLDVVRRLWEAEEEFDFEGKFFKINKGFHEPKPIQRPFPPLMNAGGSERGKHYAAKNCDVAFVIVQHDFDSAKAEVDRYRELAWKEYKRDIQVWTNSYVVIGGTEKEAKDFLNHYVVEKGDWEAATNITRVMGLSTGIFTPEVLEQFKYHFIAGWGGYPLVGTAEQVVDGLATLSKMGLDGTLINCPVYEDGLLRFTREVLPLAVQAGLREPSQT